MKHERLIPVGITVGDVMLPSIIFRIHPQMRNLAPGKIFWGLLEILTAAKRLLLMWVGTPRNIEAAPLSMLDIQE